MKAPYEVEPENHRQAMKILMKFLKMYCTDNRDGKDFKGWAK